MLIGNDLFVLQSQRSLPDNCSRNLYSLPINDPNLLDYNCELSFLRLNLLFVLNFNHKLHNLPGWQVIFQMKLCDDLPGSVNCKCFAWNVCWKHDNDLKLKYNNDSVKHHNYHAKWNRRVEYNNHKLHTNFGAVQQLHSFSRDYWHFIRDYLHYFKQNYFSQNRYRGEFDQFNVGVWNVRLGELQHIQLHAKRCAANFI